jgi:hypothetical protein
MTALMRGRFGIAKSMFTIAWSMSTLAATVQGQQRQVPRINIDSVSSEGFRAYLHSLRFAPDTESGDRQALMIGHYPDSAHVGPVAMVLPEERAHHMSPVELMSGRVIARITHENADSYPRLGLLPHTVTYWWVEYSERSEHGRSVLVAVDSAENIVARVVRGLQIISYHKEFRAIQPLARFVWTEFGEILWGWCGDHCCRLRADSL